MYSTVWGRQMQYTNNQLIKIAKLYYYEDYTHLEIADMTGLSRVTVTRMLKAAKERKLVKIVIQKSDIELDKLKKEFLEKFKVKDVVIVDGDFSSRDEIANEVCLSAAKYLSNIIHDGDLVGLGWGRMVYETINLLEQSDKNNVMIVPAIGGTDEIDAVYNLNNIVQTAAEKLHCSHIKLYAPAIVDSREICNAMKADRTIANVCNLWDKLDIAIIGIGALKTKMADKIRVFLQKHTVNFKNLGVKADILCNYFDIGGNKIETPVNDCLIGINDGQLKKTKLTVAIAGGQEKVEAISACLKNGFIDVLVTDSGAVLSLLGE